MLPLLESVCLAAMSGQFNCHISKKQGQREELVCVCESVSHLKGNYSACAACACLQMISQRLEASDGATVQCTRLH